MPGKNPLETAQAEIIGLNRKKVKELEGKLSAATQTPEAKTEKLSRFLDLNS